MSQDTLPTPSPIPVDVVVHTHWDREWYMDRETTLARLEAVMERAVADLDQGRLQQFLFDGQTVALEDLSARAQPKLMARLQEHAAAGRLVLGPWYVASDEFLVSGESLMRNLALGMRQAQALGGAQALGYLPDTFGHAAQMPQILRQFGIEHAVVWRGVESPHDLFDWQAPDGSRVAAVYLSEGYYLHPLHGPDWFEQTLSLLQRLAPRRDPAVGGPLLLTHGGDHLAPHPQLQERLEAFNRRQDRFILRQRTLWDHARHVGSSTATRTTLHGELRHNRSAFVLPDVLSTRRHLKRVHQAAEDRLLGQIEPLMAQTGADAADHAALQWAWKLLLQQQAHDSICGCSTDEVHQEMALRFVQLGRALDALQLRLLHRVGMVHWDRHPPSTAELVKPHAPNFAPHRDVFADDARFTLFNPLPWRRDDWFEVNLFLQGPKRQGLCVHDAQGERVQAQVLQAEATFELISPLDEFPERLNGYRYTVALRASIPGLGSLALQVKDETEIPAQEPAPGSPDEPLDNGAWRVELTPEGHLLLIDRRQGAPKPRCLGLISEIDAGDAYNHSPLPGAAPTIAAVWRLVGQRREGPVQEWRLAIDLQLPEGLDTSRLAPLPGTVRCSGELTLRLLGDEPLLRLSLVWHNQARDQRTRLVLGGVPQGIRETWRDTAFAWTAHAVVLSSIPDNIGRAEAPVCVQPSLTAVVAGPWMLVHRALHEHEVIVDPWSPTGTEWALGVTLVRSVGWMSRRDLRTRGVGAGPDLPTPQAQCLGEDRFDLMLVAHDEHTPAHQALHHATVLRWPALALRGHANAWAPSLDLPHSPLVMSSCRRMPDDHLELRLWNPTDQVVQLPLPRSQWMRVRADGGDVQGERESSSAFRVTPHQVITLRSAEPWSLQ